MNRVVLSMFDRKAKAYGALMSFANVEISRRAMLQVASQDNDVSKFPEDFDMYLLGMVDDETGVLTPCDPKLVFNMAELVAAMKGAN